MEDDSIDGIYNTLKDCAKISKWAGGIGLHIHNVRGTGSHIRGTNGTSNGIIPMLQVFNKTARYVDQGGGKRNGSFAIYMEPWHSDIEEFLELKKNHGDEEMRARDLFYALWIPSLFMEKIQKDNLLLLLYNPPPRPLWYTPSIAASPHCCCCPTLLLHPQTPADTGESQYLTYFSDKYVDFKLECPAFVSLIPPTSNKYFPWVRPGLTISTYGSSPHLYEVAPSDSWGKGDGYPMTFDYGEEHDLPKVLSAGNQAKFVPNQNISFQNTAKL